MKTHVKAYRIERGSRSVKLRRCFPHDTPDGQVGEVRENVPPSDSQDHVNHSPTGFEYGYGGSGPAKLAFALLFDYTEDEQFARRHYMTFKWGVIAKLDQDDDTHIIPTSRIREWIRDVGGDGVLQQLRMKA